LLCETLAGFRMDAALFDYELPPERIAQEPLPARDESRLLVVHRSSQTIEHRKFRDLLDYAKPTDLFFRNTAKVLPARIFARRPTGGRVECLLLRPAGKPSSNSKATSNEQWWCLLKPGKKLPEGAVFSVVNEFDATVLEKNAQAEYRVSFSLKNEGSVASMAENLGKMPLPPYIDREKNDPRDRSDRDRYQTVYAKSEKTVAAAAPTAGLHFTPALVKSIEDLGGHFHDLTLHVGMGTFKPLDEGSVESHQIHREIYEIPESAQKTLREAPEGGERRICIGTTSVRSVEDYLRNSGAVHSPVFTGEAALFLYPPCEFLGVDALITNFHLPKSTLLCLVSAFLKPGSTEGIAWLKEIYKEALAHDYRFLSYGDAMLIL